ALRSRRQGRRSQLRNHAQDVREQISRNGELRHLERDIAATAGGLCAGLDRLLLDGSDDFDGHVRCWRGAEVDSASRHGGYLGEKRTPSKNGLVAQFDPSVPFAMAQNR